MTDLTDLDFQPHQLAHLPLAADYMRRLGILTAVDAALPRDGRNKVSDAECVALMILNILSGRVGLYHMGPWLEATDPAVVIAEGCEPGLFSDARLGGALDLLDRLDDAWMRRFSGHPERHGKVFRTDHGGIDAGHGKQIVETINGRFALNLNDGQRVLVLGLKKLRQRAKVILGVRRVGAGAPLSHRRVLH